MHYNKGGWSVNAVLAARGHPRRGEDLAGPRGLGPHSHRGPIRRPGDRELSHFPSHISHFELTVILRK